MDTSITKRITTDSLADNGLGEKSQSNALLIQKSIPARSNLTMNELNPSIQCRLCAGYLIDATKLNECNHTFCKACIWRYIENERNKCQSKVKSKCKCIECPIKGCMTQPISLSKPPSRTVINCHNPSASLIPDTTLQDIVYILVPGLYKSKFLFFF